MSYIGTKPADAALTASDITDNIISLAKMSSGTDGNLITYDASGNPAAVATGSSGEFLKSQGAGSVPVFAAGGGIENATSFRLTTTTNNNSNADVTANWEVVDTADYSTLGSAVSQSSGIFSFPSTGYWLALCHFYLVISTDNSCNVLLKITTDNSAYTTRASNTGGASGTQNGTVAFNTVIDVTNITNVKCKFTTASFSSAYIYGETAASSSGVSFIRLGDT